MCWAGATTAQPTPGQPSPPVGSSPSSASTAVTAPTRHYPVLGCPLGFPTHRLQPSPRSFTPPLALGSYPSSTASSQVPRAVDGCSGTASAQRAVTTPST